MLQCENYRIGPVKDEIEEQLEKLNGSLQEYSAFRSTEAVNPRAAGAAATVLYGASGSSSP